MQNNNNSLLSILKSLYSQLSRISWDNTQVRLTSYKRAFKSQINITDVLNKQIEVLSSRTITESGNTENVLDEPHVKHLDRSKVKAENYEEMKVENDSHVESEFAKYLKQKKTSSVTQPHLGETLKSSAWEHIHKAIRHAKNGEVDTAKLHVTIAGTALEEAGDYMSHEDYTELVLQIEVYFSESFK